VFTLSLEFIVMYVTKMKHVMMKCVITRNVNLMVAIVIKQLENWCVCLYVCGHIIYVCVCVCACVSE